MILHETIDIGRGSSDLSRREIIDDYIYYNYLIINLLF